jgi:hypothetical protein
MGSKSALISLTLILLGCDDNSKLCEPHIAKEIYAEQSQKGNNIPEYSLYLLLSDSGNCRFDRSAILRKVRNYLENDSLNRKVDNVLLFTSDRYWDYGETLSQDWSNLKQDCVANIWFDSLYNEVAAP